MPNDVKAKKQEKVVKLSVSIPESLYRKASKKAFQEGRAFSNYVTFVVRRDVEAAA